MHPKYLNEIPLMIFDIFLEKISKKLLAIKKRVQISKRAHESVIFQSEQGVPQCFFKNSKIEH